MTLLLYDEIFLEHDTGGHPESPERLAATWQHLCDTGLVAACQREPWPIATAEQLNRIHPAEYVSIIEQIAERGGGRVDSDTIMCPLSHHVAMQASGAVCSAVEKVVAGGNQNALCLVRPPGHHALPRTAMGFCLFNHVAVAARHAVDGLGVGRVLIVDWDVHHGNGTQDVFYEDEQIGFFSIHRFPFFPGTGREEETGTGAGLGTTCNVPVEFGTSRAEYFELFEGSLVDFARKIQPELVLISAGFDAHRTDPIGSLGLEVEDFARLSQIVKDLADHYCEGKIVSMLEGGYNPSMVGSCVAEHLKVLTDSA